MSPFSDLIPAPKKTSLACPVESGKSG